MKWYPWLSSPYRQLLASYKQKRGHHAVLLHSQPGNGEQSLCYALIRWLMCINPYGNNSCRVCYSCRLMIVGNHPNYYQLVPGKCQPNIGIDSIRNIIDKLYGSIYYPGGVKVLWLPNVEQLTEPAANALLQILEEPPANTYFIMSCQTTSRLLLTLRSRCLYWPLSTPNDSLSVRWLQQLGHNKLLARTALRLCGSAPLAAEALLQPARWQERLELCTVLQNVIASGDLLALLPALNRDKKDDGPINWLLSLIADALKYHYGAQEFIVNSDQKQLLVMLAARWPACLLHTQWNTWLHGVRQLQETNSVNRELLLTNQLLNWKYGTAEIYAYL